MDTQLDFGSLSEMTFTPDWAKKDAGITIGPSRDNRDNRDNRENRGAKKPQSRKFSRDGKSFDAKKPFDRARRPRDFERVQPLAADVKVLPESKALGTIFRKLQNDTHAYKLKDLAYFFLENPALVLLKIVPKENLQFFQCQACGFAATSQEDVVEHILSAHLSDYYEAKTIACEPPKGAFTCVAKCGLSGVLLGPPNVHAFNASVKEMIRTRYPNMTEADYRSHIEMIRDEATIEEWRQSAVTKTIYVAKSAGEDAPTLTREQAEAEFKRTVLSSLLTTTKNLMITAEVAMKSTMKSLQILARKALEDERRQPFNICFALRGAFHHRKLHFFRANDARGPEFVSTVEYKEFDATHAIPELAKIAKFVAENPCQPKNVIASDAESEKQLAWLVSTGHVIAFTNGVFSAVEKYPKYGPQWQKKMNAPAEETAAEAEATPAPAPEAEATPVAEEPKEEVTLKEEEKNETAAELAE